MHSAITAAFNLLPMIGASVYTIRIVLPRLADDVLAWWVVVYLLTMAYLAHVLSWMWTILQNQPIVMDEDDEDDEDEVVWTSVSTRS